MLNANFLKALSIIIFFAYGIMAEEVCQKLLRELAQNQSEFVQCATKNSVPVTLCTTCQEPFSEMQTRYITLRETENCTKRYFDKDRINIVATTQSILIGLWNKAYCDDCYTSNNSYVFDLKKTALDDCLEDKENKGRECINCLPQYTELNDFYLSLDKLNDLKICYDLQDAMNRTRAHWSKELRCCQRTFDKLLFLLVCSFVGILPLLFYGTTYALTKRQDRNHELLIEDAPNNHAPNSSVQPSSSLADLPSTSSTATCQRVPTPNNKLIAEEFLTSSDDSDFDDDPKESKKSNKSD